MKMNQQEIFNAVWDHFVTKGRSRVVDHRNNRCMYSKGRARCAIGIFMNKDTIAKLKKHRALSRGIVSVFEDASLGIGPGDLGFSEEVPYSFLMALQRAHDRGTSTMEKELAAFAATYGLSIPTQEVRQA